MSKTLFDIKLIDLMPKSIRNDPKIIALCESLQPEIEDLQNLIGYADIYGNIDNLPEDILMALAWENGVYGAEWFLAGTLDKRRELVKNSFLLNKMRGTRWAVERIFTLLGWTAELKEWFEEGAIAGTFRVSLFDVTGVGLTEDNSKWLYELIDTYKPVSRHMTSINLYTKETPIKINAKIGERMRIKIYG